MDFSALNSFDYIVLCIVLVSVLFGFIKGFVRSVLSLAGWLIAGYISYAGFPLLKPILLTHFSNEMAVNVGGPVALYFAALIVVSLVSYQITMLLGGICGGMIDRSLGFAFGFARGALIVTVAFIGLTMIAPGMGNDKMQDTYRQQSVESEKSAPEWLRKAQTYHLLKIGEAILVSMVSDDMLNKVQQMAGFNKKSDASSSGASMLQAAKIIEQMQGVVPKNLQLDSLDMGSVDKMSPEKADKRKKDLYRIILEAYKASVKSGKIPSEQVISEDSIKQLESAISTPFTTTSSAKPNEKQQGNAAPSAGYDKKQINELERLIQTVQ